MFAPPPPLPAPPALFAKARAAATALPQPLAARELEWIADDELVATPPQALRDYRSLYATVHAWPAGDDTADQKARTEVRFEIESAAIQAFAEEGQFQQALTWLADFDPGNTLHESPAFSYSLVMREMLRQHDFSGIGPALQQCLGESDGFPFHGVQAALSAGGLPELQRMELAREGLSAVSGAADNPLNAARFLAQVHAVFPGLDGEVEDGAIALLHAVRIRAVQDRSDAGFYNRGGAQLLALLQELDPDRAATERAAFPGAGGVAANPGIIMLSATGKVAGVAAGPDASHKLSAEAAHDPDAALSGAAKLTDKDARFSALAEIAFQLANAHPQRARDAAASAYALLDQDVALAEYGYTLDLAYAYSKLDAPARSAEVAGMALDATNTHAQQSEAQMDLSTPAGAASAAGGIIFTGTIIAVEYKEATLFNPALALARLQECDCKVMQPLALAKIAEALTPAGAHLPPRILGGGSDPLPHD